MTVSPFLSLALLSAIDDGIPVPILCIQNHTVLQPCDWMIHTEGAWRVTGKENGESQGIERELEKHPY